MAASVEISIKRWREEQKMTAAELAEKIGCDISTIYRYENSRLKPDPDVMYQICAVLGDINRWCRWMRQEYPGSYGRVHPETPGFGLSTAVASLIAEMRDVHKMETEMLRNTSAEPDEEFKRSVRKELRELLSRAQTLCNIIEQKEGEDDAGNKRKAAAHG